MNQASKIMADLTAGKYFKTVVIGSKGYTIFPPSIKVLIRACRCFSQLNFPAEPTVNEIIGNVEKEAQLITQGLAYLIVGDVPDFERKAKKVKERIERGAPAEINKALIEALNIIQAGDFFACATSAMGVAKLIAQPK